MDSKIKRKSLTMDNTRNPVAIADEIIGLMEKYGGSDYAGEKVTQLQHMYQAGQLALAEGYEDEVVLAAFLHDIGHICTGAEEHEEMDGFGVMDHEEVGAQFLKQRGFSSRLIRLVESHVEAKRYLTQRDPAYLAGLSEASRRTLEFQGGPMSEEEASAFEQYPLFSLIVKMRLWDEAAKDTDVASGDLSLYREKMIKHLTSQQ